MKFNETSSVLTYDDWNKLCPDNEFVIMQPTILPPILPQSLTNKVSQCLVAHTSSVDISVFIIQLYRHDVTKGIDVIDEHQYISVFNTGSNAKYEGYIEHANYLNRTFTASFVSGSFSAGTATINQIFPTNTPNNSGSLDDLTKLGLRGGVDYSYNFAYSESVNRNIIKIL